MEAWEFEHPVSLGMKEMDRKHGINWVAPTLINLDTLDLSNPNYCVLGQQYRGYYTGLLDMTENTETTNENWPGIMEWVIVHGFTLPSALVTSQNWFALSEAWKSAITSARIERGLT